MLQLTPPGDLQSPVYVSSMGGKEGGREGGRKYIDSYIYISHSTVVLCI